MHLQTSLGRYEKKNERKIEKMELILSLLCVLVHIPTLMLRYVPFKERVSSKNKKTSDILVYSRTHSRLFSMSVDY